MQMHLAREARVTLAFAISALAQALGRARHALEAVVVVGQKKSHHRGGHLSMICSTEFMKQVLPRLFRPRSPSSGLLQR